MALNKNLPVYSIVFLFPIVIATVRDAGGLLYFLLFIFGVTLGWSAWQSLVAWEKRVLISFCLFFILVNLSFVNNHDMVYGMKKMERYLHFPLVIPMYLLLKRYAVETGKIYLLGVVVASAVMFGQALYQGYGEVGWRARAIGAYHPIILGDISMLIAVICVCALLTLALTWRINLLVALAAALAIIACVMSGSRGAWLLLPFVVPWFIWIKRKVIGPTMFIVIIVVSTLSILGALSLDRVEKRVQAAFKEYQDYSQTSSASPVGIRLEMWRDSVRIWKENPLIGTGVGDFKYDRKHFYNKGESHKGISYVHAHNIYLDVLATSGLVGIIGMLLLVLIIPFRTFYSFWIRETDPWISFYALSGMVTVVAFAVFGLTETWLARNAFVRTYLMSIIVFMSSIAIRKGILNSELRD